MLLFWQKFMYELDADLKEKPAKYCTTLRYIQRACHSGKNTNHLQSIKY